MAEKKKSPQEVMQEMRARFTMTHSQVAAEFGLPRETLRRYMAQGQIVLSSRRFGDNTSPHRYDPVEVTKAVEVYVARLAAKQEVQA